MRYALSILILSALIYLGGIAGRDFATRGEAREAVVAVSMFEGGNWILPHGYSGELPSKPPLLHWAISAFASVTGELTEFASRFPSAAAAILFLVFYYIFLMKRAPHFEAFLAAVILMSTVEWFRSATAARVDMVFSAALSSALLLLYSWQERGLKGIPVAVIIMLAAAIMAKGPVAVVLGGIIFAAFALLRREKPVRILTAGITAFAPAIALSLAWYAAAYRQGGDEFYAMVYDENFARFTGTMSGTTSGTPHKHSAVFLFGSGLLGFLPWTLLAAIPLVMSLKALKQKPAALWGRFRAVEPLAQYSALAVIAVFLFFSLPEGKRGVYLLPAYPFAAFLLARFMTHLNGARFTVMKWGGFSAAAIIALVYVVCPLLGLFHAEDPAGGIKAAFAAAQARALTWEAPPTLQAVLLVSFGAILYCCAGIVTAAQPAAVLKKCGIVFLTGFALTGSVIMPQIMNSLSAKQFAAEIAGKVPSDAPLYSFSDEFYDLSFYLRRRIDHMSWSAPPPGSYILIFDRMLPKFPERYPGVVPLPAARSENPVEKPDRHVLLVKTPQN